MQTLHIQRGMTKISKIFEQTLIRIEPVTPRRYVKADRKIIMMGVVRSNKQRKKIDSSKTQREREREIGREKRT